MVQCHPLARAVSQYDWKQRPRKHVNAHVTPRKLGNELPKSPNVLQAMEQRRRLDDDPTT
jgi:hypothetical protein